jgi:hypothetical protein
MLDTIASSFSSFNARLFGNCVSLIIYNGGKVPTQLNTWTQTMDTVQNTVHVIDLYIFTFHQRKYLHLYVCVSNSQFSISSVYSELVPRNIQETIIKRVVHGANRT